VLVLSGLVFPVLVIATVVLAAFWLHNRFKVPLVMLAVSVGCYLLALMTASVVLLQFVGASTVRSIYAAGIRQSDWLLVVLLWGAIGAICFQTSLYLGFGAGRAMKRNQTSEGALMAGLGYGGMAAIYNLAFWRGLYGSWAYFGLFALGAALGIIVELGLVTLVVLAYRRVRVFLPLGILARFMVFSSVVAVALLGGLWYLGLSACWAAAALAVVMLVRRSNWLPPAVQLA
jgi:hypothetical protein